MNDQLKTELAVLADQKKWLDAQRGKPAPQIKAQPVAEEPVKPNLWQRLKGKLGG